MPHLKFIVAGSLVIGAIVYLMFSGVNESMIYYYTVPEVKSRASELQGKGIRVSGHVSPGTIRKLGGASRIEFQVLDRASGQTLPVTYQGIIPDTFKDNAEVVVEGTFHAESGRFDATTLLAKCPSKYEKAGEEHPEEVPIPAKTD